MRKVIQMCSVNDDLHLLCDDGSIWVKYFTMETNKVLWEPLDLTSLNTPKYNFESDNSDISKVTNV